MSQLDDLNAAIKDEDVQVQTVAAVAAKIDADIAALKAKIVAGNIPADLAAQLTAIQAHTAALKTASDLLVADDANANA